jgi:citronellol/citronellal dehydrogenase
LVISPPLKLKPQWFADHCAYTMSKYGMSMCVLGMAEEFRDVGIGVNALWPATMIETAASAVLGVAPGACRRPEIIADAAHAILTRSSRKTTGRYFLDEEALAESGVTDLTQYAVRPGTPLERD